MLFRSLLVRAAVILLALAGISFASVAVRAAASDIVKVEEDWELVLGEPDLESNAPQVTCIISPTGNLSGVYAAFDINHRSQPEYSAGGLQLQLWNGDQCLSQQNLNTNGKLGTGGETVRWTTRMTLANGSVKVQVRNGVSTTWSSFGGWQHRVTQASSLSDLSGYASDLSVQQSGVGFAGNRVASLKLLKVRRYRADGQVVEDAEAKVVHAGE